MGPPGTDGERGLDGAKVQECTWITSIIVLIELDKISILSHMLWSHVYYTNEGMKFPVLWLAFVKVWGVRCQLQWKFCSSPLPFHNLQNYKQNVCRLKCMKQGSGACFSKVPRTFRVHFRWHNCLCIFKTKAYWGTKLCSYFYFYSLYNIWKDHLYRISRPEFYEWLLGPEKLSRLSRNGLQGSNIKELTPCC